MIYLAYQINERELNRNRVERIINDWLLPPVRQETLQERMNLASLRSKKEKISFLQAVAEGPHIGGFIARVGFYCGLSFKYKETRESGRYPTNLTGISISPNHASSESYVGILNLMPKFDAYLAEIGIEWEDRHKLEI